MNEKTREYIKNEQLLLVESRTHVESVTSVGLVDPTQRYVCCPPQPVLVDIHHLYFAYNGDDYENKAEAALSGVEDDLHGTELDLDGVPFDRIERFGAVTVVDEHSKDYESWDDCREDFMCNHRI